MTEHTWVDSYYDAVEFFYWEPQHIGKKKSGSANIDSALRMMEHVRRMEVTLNHNINQFFRLAPAALRNQLFADVFGISFDLPFTLHGRNVDKDFGLANATQPDGLFVSQKSVIGLELKVDARCSVSQVLKYCLLGLAVERAQGTTCSHHLLLIGTGSFPAQWKERFGSPADVQESIRVANIREFLATQPSHFRNQESRLADIAETIRIGYLRYQDFADFLRKASPELADPSPAAEVYRNLIAGMVGELKGRRLAA